MLYSLCSNRNYSSVEHKIARYVHGYRSWHASTGNSESIILLQNVYYRIFSESLCFYRVKGYLYQEILISNFCMGASSVSRNVPLPSICLVGTGIMLSQKWRKCSVQVRIASAQSRCWGRTWLDLLVFWWFTMEGENLIMSVPSTFLLVLPVCRKQHCICYHLTVISEQKFTLKISLRDLCTIATRKWHINRKHFLKMINA